MFGKDPCVNSLDARKCLLIAESELNRAQLTQDWRALTGNLRTFTDGARSFGSIASSAGALVVGLANLRGKRTAEMAGNNSWMKSILINGAGLISTFWLAFCPRGHNQHSK